MYRLQCVIHNVRKRCLFQLVLQYALDVCKPTVEHLVDVSPDRAIRVRLLVEMEQSLFGIHAADRLVDVVERDRVERLCQFRPAAAAPRLHQSRRAKLRDDSADDHRVDPNAASQKFAVHAIQVFENIYRRNDVYADGKFTSDLHMRPPCVSADSCNISDYN